MYKGKTPTKESDSQYTYSFSGWDKSLESIQEDTTFTAEFTDSLNSYTITWKLEDGTVLQESSVEYGKTPTYEGATPHLDSGDKNYSLEFDGWSPEVAPVEKDTTYTAKFIYSPSLTLHYIWRTNSYWVSYASGIGTSATIPSTYDDGTHGPAAVTGLSAGLFEDREGLVTVSLPETLTTISDAVFFDCYSLQSVNLPSSLTSIGESAFMNCVSLRNVVIPNGVSKLPLNLFSGCSSLTSFNVPASVTSIHYLAFDYCSSLSSLTVDKENLTYTSKSNCIIQISSGALIAGCSNSVIPSDGSIKTIGGRAFAGMGITSVEIPAGVVTIEFQAFAFCHSLKSVAIPSSVTSIGSSILDDCPALTSISVDSGNSLFESKDNCLIEVSRKTLVAGCSTSVIPSDGSVTIIGASAFSGSTFESLTLPSSVTTLYDLAFSGCRFLKSISMPGVTSISRRCFLNCTSLTSIVIPKGAASFGDFVFSGCSSLSSVTFEGSAFSTISASLFSDTALKTISIPSSVTSIGSCAFQRCPYLTSIIIPASVTSIGDFAFNEDTSLTSVEFKGTGLTSMPEHCFYSCSSLSSVSLPSSITSIDGNAFRNCSSLKSLALPSGILSVGEYAFYRSGLTSLSIPASLTSISSGGFAGCSSLTSISVASGNTAYAFRDNCLLDLNSKVLLIGLTGAIIPSDGSVTSLDNYSFCASKSTSIVVPEGIVSIGTAFNECSTFASISLPSSLTSISWAAFQNCTSLSSISIPKNVTSIGSSAFYGCKSLTSITIPAGVSSISDNPFVGCSSLESISVDNGNSAYHSAGNCLIDTSSKTLVSGCKNSLIPSDGSVTSLGGQCFSNIDTLTSIALPSSLTSIARSSFNMCSSLTSITLPEGLVSIGYSAFAGSGLSSINFPASLTSISDDNSILTGCASLTSITVSEGNPVYSAKGNCLIETATRRLLSGCKTSIIPSDGSVLEIDGYAFSGIPLVTIDIPDSVRSISGFVFAHCHSLKTVIVGKNVTLIGNYAFRDCPLLTGIYFKGSSLPLGWVSTWNTEGAPLYFYSASQNSDGSHWHYASDGVTPELW